MITLVSSEVRAMLVAVTNQQVHRFESGTSVYCMGMAQALQPDRSAAVSVQIRKGG